MEVNLPELFPELQQPLDAQQFALYPEDLQANQFFVDLVDQILEDYSHLGQSNQRASKEVSKHLVLKDIKEFQEIKSMIAKIMKKVIPIRVPKGTVLYTSGMPIDYGYFIIHGCVELLSKKNTWQKAQNFEGHTLFREEQRMQFLQNCYHIDPKHFHQLQTVFYEENIMFGFLPFRKLYSKGYFGFREIMGGSLRSKTAIAVEESILLKLRRQDYEKYLKDFQAKRQEYIIANMLHHVRPEVVEQILPKLRSVFNSAEIMSFDKGESIIREGDFSNSLYFLVSGEAMVSKDVKIEVPKKYLSNQNKGEFVKEMKVNLHKLVKNTFIGEIEPLLSKKNREFAYEAILNNTVLVKFDSSSFLKVISESVAYEREMIMSAKYKYSTTMEAYLSQKNTLVKSYFKQFQELDHRKKEKNVANLLKNQGTYQQNELYELFKREGAFFRDSFQRLEGFDEFQSKYDPKRSSIHRHKIKSNQQVNTADNRIKRKQNNYQTVKTAQNQQDVSFQAMKKNLMSPNKSSNPFQILSSDVKSKLLPVAEAQELSASKSSSTLRKKKRIFTKFQELKKDEAIFKRVLIKNGELDVNKETCKANRIEAIVNHKFDEVIKQCMTRKSVGVRKALMDHREDIVKQEFMRTVSSLPNRSASASRFQGSNYTYTCKGADQMRKKLDKFKYLKGPSSTITEKFSQPIRLQECIGFNKKPMSSEVRQRVTFGSSKSLHRSPKKIVLLNHMMKPITYTSSQL